MKDTVWFYLYEIYKHVKLTYDDRGQDFFLEFWSFPGGSVVKNPPAVQETQETWVQSLGQEDPLEKEMATHSSILPWRIPWTEEPGRL